MKIKMLLVAALLAGASVSARAGVHFGFSFGVPVVVAPAPVVVAPAPVAVAPVYAAPGQVVVAAPVYTAPGYVWYPGYWSVGIGGRVWVPGGWRHGYGWGGHGGWHR
jgi:hypothetical protein